MAAVSNFMLNSAQKAYPIHYMESAIGTYLSTCKYVTVFPTFIIYMFLISYSKFIVIDFLCMPRVVLF